MKEQIAYWKLDDCSEGKQFIGWAKVNVLRKVETTESKKLLAIGIDLKLVEVEVLEFARKSICGVGVKVGKKYKINSRLLHASLPEGFPNEK